jgi:hypothetical protein
MRVYGAWGSREESTDSGVYERSLKKPGVPTWIGKLSPAEGYSNGAQRGNECDGESQEMKLSCLRDI